MGEIKKLTGKQQPKPFEIHGGKNPSTGVKVVGGNPVTPAAEVKVMDCNTAPVQQNVEINLHADRASYKKALKKDQ